MIEGIVHPQQPQIEDATNEVISVSEKVEEVKEEIKEEAAPAAKPAEKK